MYTPAMGGKRAAGCHLCYFAHSSKTADHVTRRLAAWQRRILHSEHAEHADQRRATLVPFFVLPVLPYQCGPPLPQLVPLSRPLLLSKLHL